MNDDSGAVDSEDVLIRPARGKRDPDAAPDLVLAMTGPVLDRLVARFEARPLRIGGSAVYRAWEVRPGEGAPRLTLAGPFLGAPHSVIGLEKMIALGAERIWVTGWCGSLQPDLRIGDLVMPIGAFSDEGTSRHYPLEGDTPKTDQGLRRELGSALARRGMTARTGRVWSTDAPYRETHGKVRAFRDSGLVAVDMELSALLAVSAYRGVRLAGLLVVSDELSDLTWRPGFSDPRLREAEEAVAEVLNEAVLGS
ncbi:MAG: nucleoside phosphorylase [Desulfatiglandales bacterium]